MAASAEQITATIDRYVEVFSTGDKDGYLGAVRTRRHGRGSGRQRGLPRSGRDRRLLGRRAGADAHDHAAAGRLAARRRRRGRLRLQALPELGDTKMVVDIIDVMSFDDDGRITSLRAYWDMAEMRPYDG